MKTSENYLKGEGERRGIRVIDGMNLIKVHYMHMWKIYQ
jgi:hypothetical protein